METEIKIIQMLRQYNAEVIKHARHVVEQSETITEALAALDALAAMQPR
jgi:hypothetical protein